jgi:hypothetical protein
MCDGFRSQTDTTHDPPKQDWVLQSLVSMINGTDLEIGVVLTIRGIVISGNLVSGHLYFEEFNSELERLFRDKETSTITESSYSRFRHIYPWPAFEEDSDLPPAYIHLKHAKLLQTRGTRVPSDGGVWWRGRICEVDGFSLAGSQKSTSRAAPRT